MQIKVFKAGNMKDAMAAMKAELGDDAVILHSKKYKEGGLLGIGSREVVEITAAVEESSMPKKIETPRLKHPTVATSSVINRYKTDGTAQGVAGAERSAENISSDKKEETSHSLQTDDLSEKVSEQKKSAAPQKNFEDILQEVKQDSPLAPVEEKSASVEKAPAPEEKSQPVEKTPAPEEKSQPVEKVSEPEEKIQSVEKPAPEDKPVEKSAPEDKSQQQVTTFTQEQMAQTQAMIMAQFNQMQMMQQAAIAQTQPVIQNDAKLKKLEEEIAHMKALLTEILGRESNKGGVSLHEALKMQEVDEDILKEMAAQANAGETLADMHTPAAKATLLNYLNEHVKFSDGVKLNRHGVRIVALLGTTGVGKTTTLAKIAAKFVLEQRSSVALITADTYRISAVEQLKTYSDILELPLEIVYNPPELASAIERHRNKELILIDTAGRSQHNEYQMRELEEFLRVNPRIEKHLVISATTKYTDAKQIMNKFAQVNPDRIIFTKIDETGSVGMIVNLLNDNRYSLSYITTGQSVPDDIERANSEVLTNLLLQKVEE